MQIVTAELTNIKPEQCFISKVSVWRAFDHLEATKLCIWWEVMIAKHLHFVFPKAT